MMLGDGSSIHKLIADAMCDCEHGLCDYDSDRADENVLATAIMEALVAPENLQRTYIWIWLEIQQSR